MCRGTELQDLSLVLTTQHGHVMGESSVLGSLGQGASGQLVAHAPLMDVCGLLSPSLNILLAAVVCTGTCEVATVRPESTGNVSLEDSEQELFMPSLHLPKMPVNDGQSGANTSQNRVYKIYTQWLCKVDVAFGTLSECLDSKWCLGIRQGLAPLSACLIVVRDLCVFASMFSFVLPETDELTSFAVVKYQQLVVSSTDEEHLSLLPSIVKSCLSMVDSTETHDSRVILGQTAQSTSPLLGLGFTPFFSCAFADTQVCYAARIAPGRAHRSLFQHHSCHSSAVRGLQTTCHHGALS